MVDTRLQTSQTPSYEQQKNRTKTREDAHCWLRIGLSQLTPFNIEELIQSSSSCTFILLDEIAAKSWMKSQKNDTSIKNHRS